MGANWTLDKTFTATGNTVANSSTSWSRLDPAGGAGSSGNETMGEQALRTFVTFNAASGTATLAFCITEIDTSGTEELVHYHTATVTGDASRTTQLDNSGTAEYVAQTVWSITGRDTIDLLGHFRTGTRCYIGCTALGTATSVRVRVSSTKNAG